MNFYYEGILRLDWGFGNPNRTATLIAALMMATWGLAYCKKWGFWLASLLSLLLGLALVQTFSRGGILALALGSAALIFFAPRPWPRARILAVLLSLGVLTGYAICTTATDRYAASWQGDLSVLNRLDLWRSVPKMIADSPAGWGWGNSQNAYMQWYQGIERPERFLNLVSLHFSLLAEFGWPLRLGYMAFWILGAVIAFPGKTTQALSVPFALLITVFVGGIFTHFGDSWMLYFLPPGALLAACLIRWRSHIWPSRRSLLAGVIVTLVGAGAVFLWGTSSEGFAIRGDRDRVIVGRGQPVGWIVVDPAVLGSHYGKTFRRFLASHDDFPAWGFVATLDQAPSGQPLVLTGQTAGESLMRLRNESIPQLTLLNVALFPQQLHPETLRNTRCIFGELAHSDTRPIWTLTTKPHIVEGVGNYLPEWPSLLIPTP